MKKIIAIILVLAAVLCLAGCSGNKVSGEIISEKPETEAAETEETTPAAEETPAEETAEPEEEAPAEEEAAAPEEDAGFEFGTSTAEKYENKFFGIGFAAEGWRFQTEEEIAQQNGLVKDMLDENTAAAMERSTTFTDMFAMSPDSTQNINITIQKFNPLQSLIIDEKTYADQSVPEVKSAIEGMGAENVSVTVEDYKLGDETHKAIRLSYTFGGMEMNQLAVVLKQGSYFANITSTSTGEAAPEQALENFYSL